MVTLSRYGCASSAAAMTGKSAIVASSSGRWGRAAAHRRRASRRSKARPRRSSASSKAAASGTRDLGFELLDPPQPRVPAAPSKKLLVRSLLDHASVLEDDDAIRDLRRAQPMRDEQDRAFAAI